MTTRTTAGDAEFGSPYALRPEPRTTLVQMASVREVLAAFPGARRSGAGWIARCPAHDDRHPSLSIARGRRTGWVIHCHAGCRIDAVLTAAGLTMGDVMFEHHAGPRRAETVVATYDYCDEFGVLIHQVVRFDPKAFRQRKRGPDERWDWSVKDTRRVLYRLHELKGCDTVYVTEGEKDADRLWSVGLPATTNAGGAGKWRDEYAQQLLEAGVREVVVLPDHDDAGRAHAHDVASNCRNSGIFVRVVTLPNLTTVGADVSDWLDAGHTADELRALARATAEFSMLDTNDAPTLTRSRLPLMPLAQLLAEAEGPTEWLVENRIPVGGVVLFVGKPKTGKSTAARDLAFAVATGEQWLGHRCRAGTVWYIALEEKRSEVRYHLQQMGATGQEPISLYIARASVDLVTLLMQEAEEKRPALIIIDTLARCLQLRDINDYSEVTQKLDPLIHLARSTGAALVLLHHANKGVGRSGQDIILGSTALAGSVDNILLLTRCDRYRLLSSEQRIGPDLPETVIEMAADGRVTAPRSKHAADVAHIAQVIVSALASAAGAVTRDDLLDRVEARHTLKLEALNDTVAAGTIIRSGSGSRGDPYRYALASAADSGSQVPPEGREPESSSLESSVGSSADCGSRHVPGSRDTTATSGTYIPPHREVRV